MKNDSILGQIQATFAKGNRLAAAVGFALGGINPALTFFIDHYEIDASKALYGQISAYLVLAGMVFSALTVYSWAQIAFRNKYKALGFVGLVEGAMIFSTLFPLACVALAFLVAINGVATACNLVLDWQSRQAVAKAIKQPQAMPQRVPAKRKAA